MASGGFDSYYTGFIEACDALMTRLLTKGQS